MHYSTSTLILAIQYLLPDTFYLILTIWYLLADTCYLQFPTWYLSTRTYFAIFAFWSIFLRLVSKNYLILITSSIYFWPLTGLWANIGLTDLKDWKINFEKLGGGTKIIGYIDKMQHWCSDQSLFLHQLLNASTLWKVLAPKDFGSNNFWSRKFKVKKILDQKKMLVKNILVKKKCMFSKIK